MYHHGFPGAIFDSLDMHVWDLNRIPMYWSLCQASVGLLWTRDSEIERLYNNGGGQGVIGDW